MFSKTVRIFLRLCIVCFIIHGFQLGSSQAKVNSSCALSYSNDWLEKKVGTSCANVQQHNKTMFCNMIDYNVYEKTHGDYIERDQCARTVVDDMLKVLNTYDCSRPYGYHSCSDCIDAYKYWICSQVFPRCESTTKLPIAKTCISICQDVQRKCPYVLGFKCPNSHTLIESGYSTEKSVCNKMGRELLVEGYEDVFPEKFG